MVKIRMVSYLWLVEMINLQGDCNEPRAIEQDMFLTNNQRDLLRTT